MGGFNLDPFNRLLDLKEEKEKLEARLKELNAEIEEAQRTCANVTVEAGLDAAPKLRGYSFPIRPFFFANKAPGVSTDAVIEALLSDPETKPFVRQSYAPQTVKAYLKEKHEAACETNPAATVEESVPAHLRSVFKVYEDRRSIPTKTS